MSSIWKKKTNVLSKIYKNTNIYLREYKYLSFISTYPSYHFQYIYQYIYQYISFISLSGYQNKIDCFSKTDNNYIQYTKYMNKFIGYSKQICICKE